jgi:nucleotide-binding universal stress UspA family protein
MEIHSRDLEGWVTISRVLAPVDFSPCSISALKYAAYFAQRLGATLDLVHVREGEEDLEPKWFGPGQRDFSEFPEVSTYSWGRELVALVNDLARVHNLPVRGRILFGEPGRAILKVSSAERHGLIVMGTHGRSGLSRLAFGSVAEKVVRDARCPVLTVRVEKEET